MQPEFFIVLVAACCALLLVITKRASRVTIYDFQKGLLYKKGSFVKVLSAGRYRLWRPNAEIQVVDIRRAMLNVPGQEILTKDSVGVKLSLSGFYEVTDPAKARHQSQNYLAELYSHAQLALRDIVSAHTLDEVLEKRVEIDAQLLSKIAEKAAALGLAVSAIAVRDIILPGQLKRAYSGIIEAKKEAQKQLEKARGEQAVLRNLANASSLFDGNPMLLQARIIQSLSSGHNTVVFNAPDKDGAVVKKAG